MPGTPVTPDVNSPTSSQSSLTPSIQSMSLGRGRGRPNKWLDEPSYGYPVDGTEEEKTRWLKQKATKQWRYNILTSKQAEEYHQHEKEWVHNYNARKHQQRQPTAAAGAPAATPSVKEKDDKTEKSKAQSRLQYIKYVNSIKNYICPQLVK